MLEPQLEQATLKNLLEALIVSDLFSEASFDFSRTGLEVQAVDTHHSALVVLRLRAEAFNHYRCDSDLTVGLNLADMAKAIRCANNDDIITIKDQDDWPDTLLLTFESAEDGESSLFEIDFVGIKDVPFEISESEYQAVVRMPSAKLMRICKKLSSFGDSGDSSFGDSRDRDTVDKGCVEFFTRGKTRSSTIVCTVGKPKEPIHIEMKEKLSVSFDLRYMNCFSKVSTLSDEVTISISYKLPVVFEYKIAEMSYIRYYVVPRSVVPRIMVPPRIKLKSEGDKMQNEGDEMQI